VLRYESLAYDSIIVYSYFVLLEVLALQQEINVFISEIRKKKQNKTAHHYFGKYSQRESSEILAQPPREAVDVPSLEALEARLDGVGTGWAVRSLPTQAIL